MILKILYLLFILVYVAWYFLPTFVMLYFRILQKIRCKSTQKIFPPLSQSKYIYKKSLIIENWKQPDWKTTLKLLDSDYNFIYVVSDQSIVEKRKEILHLCGDVDFILFRNKDGSLDLNNFILRNSLFTKRKLLDLIKGGNILDQLYTDHIPGERTVSGREDLDEKLEEKLEKKFKNSSPTQPFRLTGICVFPKVVETSYVLIDFSQKVKREKREKRVKKKKRTIPKLIFQTMETKLVPKGQYRAMKLWKIRHPDYSYHFFDGLSARNFMEKNYPGRVFQAYEKLIPGAYKADLFRYCLLYKYGGNYVDSRSKPIVKLSEYISDTDSMVIPLDRLPCYLWQGFLCSIPKHPILKLAIEKTTEMILTENYGKTSLDITGPSLFGRVVNEYLNRSSENYFREGIIKDRTGNLKILTHGFDGSYIRYKNRRIILTKYVGNDEQKFLGDTGKEKYSAAWDRRRVFKPN